MAGSKPLASGKKSAARSGNLPLPPERGFQRIAVWADLGMVWAAVGLQGLLCGPPRVLNATGSESETGGDQRYVPCTQAQEPRKTTNCWLIDYVIGFTATGGPTFEMSRALATGRALQRYRN